MNRARRPALLLDAARNARPSQVLGRIRRIVPPAVLAMGLVESEVAWRPIAGGVGTTIAPQSGPVRPPHEDRVFRAVGVTRRFEGQDFWSDGRDGLLFLFHLHGFVALADYAAGERSPEADEFWARVTRSWLAAHARPSRTAWHPFPTSQRVVAWCSALATLDWPRELAAKVAEESLRQARYVARAVERDIGGNHVIKNGLALVTAGVTFPASRLQQQGLRLLEREVGRQVLADGGHEERSTSYHLAVLDDLMHVAELLRRTGDRPPIWLTRSIERMDSWTAAMRGPDGRLPMVNDAWEAPPAARRVQAEVTELRESGYLVLRSGDDQLTFDAGPLSPRHLPPHAHADALSFVLWADGRQVVVDAGTFTYTGPRRAEFRATRAHNTVEVDGEDQCVFWGDFRLAFPPRVRMHPIRRHREGIIIVSGSHDGYRRLPHPVLHSRSIVWWPGHGIVVVDLLIGRHVHRVRSWLHLAPGEGHGSTQPLVVRSLEAPDASTVSTYHSPYLGQALPAPALEVDAMVQPGDPFGWSLLRSRTEVVTLTRDRVELRAEGRNVAVPLTWES